MDKGFWHKRWAKNEIGFHMDKPHHDLLRFFSLLQVKPGETVFVPLCGKSPDLAWLREQGLDVVGVELSRTAVNAFISENNLSGKWTTAANMPCFVAPRCKLFCGDFFELTAVDLGKVRAAYDRGSLVALPAGLRASYAEKLAELLPRGSRVLLVSYEYDQKKTAGPPFSVPLPEVECLLGEAFRVELLAEEDRLWSHQGLADRGVTSLTEFVVLLERR